MLSKVNVFENNGSMNIMKHKASLQKVTSEKKKDVKSKKSKGKNVFIISFIFFGKFAKG